MTLTVEKFNEAVEKAMSIADESTENMYGTQLNQMIDACGFAWLINYTKGRTKLGKILAKSKNFKKAYNGGYQMWTSGIASRTQNMCVKEYWCRDVANELNKLPEFTDSKFYVSSRMD